MKELHWVRLDFRLLKIFFKFGMPRAAVTRHHPKQETPVFVFRPIDLSQRLGSAPILIEMFVNNSLAKFKKSNAIDAQDLIVGIKHQVGSFSR
ncbi:hypothetical protein MFFC18_08940 [Mariniblastus fucicola]|uniref:Uncharacterized protein n=1 Tax=Mariniblastus fucicola TaxID=980251 RepID=A0A5B9P7V8_9BACT|nr:hypothetical protein MFFC18_08940 [Mariniblastus fucicola]